MQVAIIKPNELSSELISRWHEIQGDCPELGSPYFCAEFTMAVGSVRQDVFVGIIEEGGKVVGFFPFQKGRLRKGRPVGGPLSDYHGVIAADGALWEARELVENCGLSCWDYDHLLETQAPFRPYHTRRSQSPYMNVSDGYMGYVDERARFGTKQVKQVSALERKLKREWGDVRFECCVHDKGVLEQLVRWKSAQYRRSGIVDVFAFNWTLELLHTIHETACPRFAGMLSALFVGDRVIAAHMGMRSKRVLHYWFPAYDREFARYSPGLILLLKLAEAGAAMGVERVDLGKGEALYKRRLASGSTPLAEGSVVVSKFVRASRKAREVAEALVRRTPLIIAARIPGRAIKAFERSRRFH